MKIVKKKYEYHPETHRLLKVEEVGLDMVDTTGRLLKEGQKVWYARAEKSAPSELFKATITKLTSSSVTLEYEDPTAWRPEVPSIARLTSGHLNFKTGKYRFKQIAVIK